ncbi:MULTISPECIES: dTMP kinase [Exiguobacterium]|uniref:Thymidylate kinase n=1 Tax=Exiguobacterium sibiricum (strain DSM 17290 / CCUG 55495 / CIP 109462 / JCM 13490 / 255-15) TaxID=262543 RepID=KTHY_EXIS2|nr:MULTISPECIES: dTMP kinase [Exiguobacterium]B1YGD3.1 RecName: Full=Thymidylate kinase; AltName: Full=dTMP kinase [Exiguobacterium sibiricum 255-15]ACB59510.1 dTMP kinase [Exiguobacterium sibiricum 255-15]MCT4793636.1 dTMP kinase [Exiguobacterium artemiae]
MTGTFITVEGPDGAGKTTQLQLLADRLTAEGYEIVMTREPGGTRIGNEIRSLILNPDFQEMDEMTEILLYAASRAQHVNELIRPALAAGKIVLCDRFIDASIAYQGYGLGYTIEQVRSINQQATNHLTPDRTYLFDLTVSESKQRMMDRGALDRIEQRDDAFRQRVYDGFMTLAVQEPERIQLVDANQSIESLQTELCKDVLTYLKKRERLS